MHAQSAWSCHENLYKDYESTIFSAQDGGPDTLFFISIRVNCVEAQYAENFPNLNLKLCLMICLISKLISWSDIGFDLNIAMVSFKCSNLNIQLSLT